MGNAANSRYSPESAKSTEATPEEETPDVEGGPDEEPASTTSSDYEEEGSGHELGERPATNVQHDPARANPPVRWTRGESLRAAQGDPRPGGMERPATEVIVPAPDEGSVMSVDVSPPTEAWLKGPVVPALTTVPGIGKVTAEKLQAVGIETTSQLIGKFLYLNRDEKKFGEWLAQVASPRRKKAVVEAIATKVALLFGDHAGGLGFGLEPAAKPGSEQ